MNKQQTYKLTSILFGIAAVIFAFTGNSAQAAVFIALTVVFLGLCRKQ